ncbi:hypothetical protein [Actinomadura verrucosospora]
MHVKPLPGHAASGARLLRELLVSDPHYRRLWRRYVTRESADLNQAAVAKVIQEYLWESGIRSDTSTKLARQLKDRISRALNGSALSMETLDWFIAAFDMDERDERRLRDVLAGRHGGMVGISHTLSRRREMIRRQCHRTISLVERYYLDGDGSLKLRRTYHTIRALEDDVDIYIFNYEPEASNVEVVHGGQIGKRYEYGGGLTSIEIMLEKPLMKAESTVLEYCTYFAGGSATLTEVRRAAFGRCENVDYAVHFDSLRVPRAAWWCAWDDQIGGDRVVEESIEIEKCVIRRFVPYVEESVVGFRWKW